MHSHTSTPFPLGSQTAHWAFSGQYTLTSHARVASLTRPGMAGAVMGSRGVGGRWRDWRNGRGGEEDIGREGGEGRVGRRRGQGGGREGRRAACRAVAVEGEDCDEGRGYKYMAFISAES